MIDLDALEAAARAAQEAWDRTSPNGFQAICRFRNRTDPAAILALVARLREAEREIKRLHGLYNEQMAATHTNVLEVIHLGKENAEIRALAHEVLKDCDTIGMVGSSLVRLRAALGGEATDA
jgi:hypothetical protein